MWKQFRDFLFTFADDKLFLSSVLTEVSRLENSEGIFHLSNTTRLGVVLRTNFMRGKRVIEEIMMSEFIPRLVFTYILHKSLQVLIYRKLSPDFVNAV